MDIEGLKDSVSGYISEPVESSAVHTMFLISGKFS